jgi:hypothetical protein
MVLLLDQHTAHTAFGGPEGSRLELCSDFYVHYVPACGTGKVQPIDTSGIIPCTKNSLRQSGIKESTSWLNRVHMVRHHAAEFCRQWDSWKCFARCGWSTYGRVHWSRLHTELRAFLVEQRWSGVPEEEREEGVEYNGEVEFAQNEEAANLDESTSSSNVISADMDIGGEDDLLA